MPPLIDSFTLPGYPGNEVDEQNAAPSSTYEARPSVPAYTIQPVVWLFVTLAACVIGLYFFLEE